MPHCTFIVLLLTSLVYSKLSQSQRCVVTHKTMWQSRYCELAALFTQNNEQLSSVNLGHGFTLIKTKKKKEFSRLKNGERVCFKSCAQLVSPQAIRTKLFICRSWASL